LKAGDATDAKTIEPRGTAPVAFRSSNH